MRDNLEDCQPLGHGQMAELRRGELRVGDGTLVDLSVHPARTRPFPWQEYLMSDLWRRCLERLEGELSAEDVHTWLMPLQAREDVFGLHLYAPNPYSLDTVREQFLAKSRPSSCT